MNPLYPVFLNLTGKKVLIVGAGQVANQKIVSLLPSSPQINIVSLKACAEVVSWVEKGKVSLELRAFREEDLLDKHLVISATNDSLINAEIAALSRKNNLWINAVDDPPSCDLFMGAVLDRGPLRLAISTSGEFPGLSGLIKKILDELLPESHDDFWKRISDVRLQLKEVLGTPEERMDTLRRVVRELEEKYFNLKKLNKIQIP